MNALLQSHGALQRNSYSEDSGYATGSVYPSNAVKSNLESTTQSPNFSAWNEQLDFLEPTISPFVYNNDSLASVQDSLPYYEGGPDLNQGQYLPRYQGRPNEALQIESTLMHKSKRPQSDLYDDGQLGPDNPRNSKHQKLSSSEVIDVNQDQELTLLRSLEDWQKRDRLPSEKELKALATLTKIPFFKVALWCGDKLRIRPKVNKHQLSGVQSLDVDPEILRDIENYISEAGDKDCTSHHSRTAAGGKYCCTSNCGFSTDSRDSWERHEEIKQPQQFWHCAICHETRKTGELGRVFIAHRCDKFLPHAKNYHQSTNPDELRQQSKISYPAPLIKTCTFKLRHSGKACGQQFSSWQERNDHYIDHFNGRVPGGPWYMPRRDDSDTESDEDDHGPQTGFGKGSRGWKSKEYPVPSGSNTNHQTSRRTGNQGNSSSDTSNTTRRAGGIDSSSVCQSNESRIAMERRDVYRCVRQVIDVEGYCVVKVTKDTRYFALKYSSEHCLPQSVKQPSECPALPNVNQLPVILQRALNLSKEMGFRYLWIDTFCGLDSTTETVDTIYREAGLILLVGRWGPYREQIWHFTCHYSHLQTVQTWTQQSVSFHHLQLLGHGAYSVVDKVELRPTQETFARKIVFRMNTRRVLKARHLQEMEIMQKFNHPHITKFVAAYYDRDAFNIIMTPVADCDLRQFLSCPDQFPEKRPHLLQWFMSLAEALTHMHDRHCRHKDIKPANILISGAKVLLTDFGTSFDFSNSSSSTYGGSFMTPKYCAPEVAAKEWRGRPADIFSLGCVFTEMITVELGKTLDDLHYALNIEEYSGDRQATYPEQIEGLVGWLHLLYSDCKSDIQRRVLNITESMLSSRPRSRPTALKVTKALCPREKCMGLRPAATCHCCPGGSSLIQSNGIQVGLLPRNLPSLAAVSYPGQMLRILFLTTGCPVATSAPISCGVKSHAALVAILIHWNMQAKTASSCPWLQVLKHAVQAEKSKLDPQALMDGTIDSYEVANNRTKTPLSSASSSAAAAASRLSTDTSSCSYMDDVGNSDDAHSNVRTLHVKSMLHC